MFDCLIANDIIMILTVNHHRSTLVTIAVDATGCSRDYSRGIWVYDVQRKYCGSS